MLALDPDGKGGCKAGADNLAHGGELGREDGPAHLPGSDGGFFGEKAGEADKGEGPL
ncbi:MAG: hypothetical protein S4CHLAM102_07070 [Chlamydiia bacterium]|nr:hypothetical protein [Chlamydiia bacterium]